MLSNEHISHVSDPVQLGTIRKAWTYKGLTWELKKQLPAIGHYIRLLGNSLQLLMKNIPPMVQC